VSRPALGPTKPLIEWVAGIKDRGVNLTTDAHPVSSYEWLEPYIFCPNTPSWIEKE